MTRKEFITSREHVFTNMQLALLNVIEDYMRSKNINRVQLSKELGVSKGYVSQVLNADYDHKMSKLVDLALSSNKIPLLLFVDADRFVKNDIANKTWELIPVKRPHSVTFEKKGATINDNNSLEVKKKSKVKSGKNASSK